MGKIKDNSIFIDTNVLIYANVVESPLHRIAINAIEYYYKEDYDLWINRQVLREYLAVMTRPNFFKNIKPAKILIKRIQYFQNNFMVADNDQFVTDMLLELITKVSVGGKQIHDANIVSTMLVNGIGKILTHNVDDFKRFSDYINIEPLIK